MIQPTFAIESTSLSSSRPSASTVLDAQSGVRDWMVTFDHRRPDNTVDVAAVALRGSTPISPLTYLSNSGNWAGISCVDSDGSSFVVTYARSMGDGDFDGKPAYALTYALDDGEILPLGAGAVLDDNFFQVLPNPRVAAERSGGGTPGRFWIGRMYHPLASQIETSIRGDLWESPGLGWSYGNANANSSGNVARIMAHGSRSLIRGEWSLRVSGAPANRPGLFFFGSGQVDVPFGEGRRLVGPQVVRMHPVVTTDGNGEVTITPQATSSWYAALQAGPTNMNYQFWFRDPGHDGNGDGTAAGHNLTDAVSVEHRP
jgi:hypothetical protein